VDRFAAMHSFRRVVEARSFSAAARQLRVSAATVTKHVAALERDLGVTLLHRTTRSVTPSDAGAEYYERCARILDDLDEADATARADQQEPRGAIRVNAPVSFGLVHLGAVIARFRERHPRVRVELSMSDRFINPVAEGVDVVVRITRTLTDLDFTARKLGTMRRIVCASPAYLARRAEPRNVQDLATHDVAIYAGNPRADVFEFETESGVHEVRVDPCFVADNSLLLRDAVVAGIGIAVLPSYVVADDLAAGRVRMLLPRVRPIEHTIYALSPRRRDQSARTRAFVDFLADALADAPPTTRRPAARRSSGRRGRAAP
jgi:DNA-binding transcriptional LysR family regulator